MQRYVMMLRELATGTSIMIHSMTGFSCKSLETKWGVLTFEIRSVNHRYLELGVRLPDYCRDLEKSVREHIQKKVQRGKIEVQLRFQPGEAAPFQLIINKPLMAQLAKASKTVTEFFPDSTVDTMTLLSWPGILQTSTENASVMNDQIVALLEMTIEDWLSFRAREGESINQFLRERLSIIQNKCMQIQERMPSVILLSKQKMRARFEELAVTVDSDRLEQELLWLSQKTDIAEELQRIDAHVKEVTRVLGQSEAVGRKLDFLMQELNREANTLGSKSVDAEITQAVVELKVQIEQMREQVQNIE